jgi:hypothetical protein
VIPFSLTVGSSPFSHPILYKFISKKTHIHQ